MELCYSQIDPASLLPYGPMNTYLSLRMGQERAFERKALRRPLLTEYLVHG